MGKPLPILSPVPCESDVVMSLLRVSYFLRLGHHKLFISCFCGLSLQNTFIKDSNSLGFYNITSATTVLLGLKERGGRKK